MYILKIIFLLPCVKIQTLVKKTSVIRLNLNLDLNVWSFSSKKTKTEKNVFPKQNNFSVKFFFLLLFLPFLRRKGGQGCSQGDRGGGGCCKNKVTAQKLYHINNMTYRCWAFSGITKEQKTKRQVLKTFNFIISWFSTDLPDSSSQYEQ